MFKTDIILHLSLMKFKILNKIIPSYLKATYNYIILANQTIKKKIKILQYICYQITTTLQKKYFLDCSLKQNNYRYITTKINQSTLKTVLPWMTYWTKQKNYEIDYKTYTLIQFQTGFTQKFQKLINLKYQQLLFTQTGLHKTLLQNILND